MSAIAGKWDQIKDTAGAEKKGVCMNIYAMGPCACAICGVEDNKEGRDKCCCPCCLALYMPDCKGGFAGIGVCVPPTITVTDEGFDGAFFGIFAKYGVAAPTPEAMQDV